MSFQRHRRLRHGSVHTARVEKIWLAWIHSRTGLHQSDLLAGRRLLPTHPRIQSIASETRKASLSAAADGRRTVARIGRRIGGRREGNPCHSLRLSQKDDLPLHSQKSVPAATESTQDIEFSDRQQPRQSKSIDQQSHGATTACRHKCTKTSLSFLSECVDNQFRNSRRHQLQSRSTAYGQSDRSKCRKFGTWSSRKAVDRACGQERFDRSTDRGTDELFSPVFHV